MLVLWNHGGGAASPAQEIEGLVATDVEKAGGEVWQQFGVEAVQERERCGIRRTERRRILLEAAPRKGRPTLRQFRQMVVGGLHQPAFEVSEGVLVRHEVDAPKRAVGVQFADLLRRERRGRLPDVPVRRIGKCMLGVELKLVVLELREQVDDQAERPHRRNLVPADVEHVGTIGKHRQRPPQDRTGHAAHSVRPTGHPVFTCPSPESTTLRAACFNFAMPSNLAHPPMDVKTDHGKPEIPNGADGSPFVASARSIWNVDLAVFRSRHHLQKKLRAPHVPAESPDAA